MKTSDLKIQTAFLEFSRQQLIEKDWPRLTGCVKKLSDEQVWWRPNEASNSIGNLILHLDGNVNQWLVSSFKRAEDKRDRPAEFQERQRIPASVLLDKLGKTLQKASDVLASVSEADLLATVEIQGYTVNGLEAIYHVVEHFGIHCGQIAYITKLLSGEDLGFYRELDTTGRKPGH